MEHLTIRNFGPVKDIDIELKKLNVFIGEQGVGKSTIAKLLSCLRDVSLYDVIINDRGQEIVDQIFGIYGISGYFRPDSYIKYYDGDDFTVEFEDGKFSLSSEKRDYESLNVFLKRVINACLNETFKKLGVAVKDLDESQLADVMDKHRNVLMSNLRLSFYCPAERGIVGAFSNSLASLLISKVPLPDTLMEYMSFFEKAKNQFKTYDFPFLNARYQLKDGEDMVVCGDSAVPLRYSSSGIQSIVPLLMVMDYCVSENYFTSFTIEEPELNLFPSNQLELLRQILAKTNTEKCKVGSWTLTTHSPYTLSILNISLLGGLILQKSPGSADELSAVMPLECVVKPDEIAVYSLDHADGGDKPNCVSVIDESTGLIKANYLDAVSDILSGEFNKLYKMYLSSLRKSK